MTGHIERCEDKIKKLVCSWSNKYEPGLRAALETLESEVREDDAFWHKTAVSGDYGEPWRDAPEEAACFDCNGIPVLAHGVRSRPEIAKATRPVGENDAIRSRVVACVNAMADLNPTGIAELIAAAEYACKLLELFSGPDRPAVEPERSRLRSALAAVRRSR